MVDVTLSETDTRLLELHGAIYPMTEYGTSGTQWFISSPDGNEIFPTYKSFIKWIEEEVKEALLRYAFNKELGELADI